MIEQRIRETIFESKIERASDDVDRKRSLQERERENKQRSKGFVVYEKSTQRKKGETEV